METKNGLQEWFELWNVSRESVPGVELTFPVDRAPARVLDIVSGAAVPFLYANGGVRVPGLTLAPGEFRVFGIDRADSGEAADAWFAVKARFETAPQAPVQLPALQAPPLPAQAIEQFRFRTIDDATRAAGSWIGEATNGPAYKTIGCGFLADMGLGASGHPLYRASLNVPAAWAGRRVYLEMALTAQDMSVFLGQAVFFLNGHKLPPFPYGMPHSGVLDITSLTHPGANDVAVLDATGYVGGLYLFSEAPLDDTRDLSQGWQLYSDDVHHAAAPLPIDGKGRCLAIDVAVPAGWDKHRVYLEIDQGAARWLTFIMVNDRPISYTWYCHPFPSRLRINLAPLAVPGAQNHIELWGNPDAAAGSLTLATAGLGTTIGAGASME
jgi:hypothetical protein